MEHFKSVIEDIIVAVATGAAIYGDKAIGLIGSLGGLLFVYYKVMQKKREGERAKISLELEREKLKQYRKLVEDYEENRLPPDLVKKLNDYSKGGA